jgi:ribosomal-protein-alanine N-acetyltransferase
MQPHVRAAAETDVDAILAIERASFADPWSAPDFRSVMNTPQTIFLVAEDESGVIGYVVVLTVLDESEVLNLAVAPARRGAAIGSLLLDTAIAGAAERGARETFLEVRESNAAARRLYASRGFAEISRRRGYYRSPVEDALVLRRALQ